jgi:hypothetical protein
MRHPVFVYSDTELSQYRVMVPTSLTVGRWYAKCGARPLGGPIGWRWHGILFITILEMALGSTQPLTEMSTRNLKKDTWG